MRIAPLFALFLRSLRQEARSAVVATVRILLGGMIIFALFLAHEQQSLLGAAGLFFFKGISFINFYFITLAGLGYFASAITEEKEEMTLGLLLMTDLSPVAILLGKSTSRFFGALLLLAAQIPFILLAVTLGGVSLIQICGVTVTLLAYLFALSNFALFWSVVSRRTAVATFWTGLFWAGFFLSPWLGKIWIQDVVASGRVEATALWLRGFGYLIDRMIEISPGLALQKIFLTGYAGPVLAPAVWASMLLGVTSFLLAWASFERSTREEKEVSPARAAGTTRRRRVGGLLGAGRVWERALVWKDYYFLSGGIPIAILKLPIYGCVIGVIAREIRPDNLSTTREIFGSVAMLSMLIVLGFEGLFLSSRIFYDELRWKTWSSLLTLPLSMGQILRQKLLGGMMGWIPAVIWFVVGAFSAPEAAANALGGLGTWQGVSGIFFTVFEILILLYGVAFLSVVVPRLAMVLGLGVWIVANLLFILIFTSLRWESDGEMFAVFFFFIILTILILHGALLKRLKSRGAD